MFGAFIPDIAPILDYTHVPLIEQFESQGIRQIELDVFYDPEGGLFSEHQGRTLFGEDAASGIPELDEPGLKVFHVQEIDYETTCYTFLSCISEIKTWSDSNTNHLPIMVLVEVKDEQIDDPLELNFAADADTVQARTGDTTQRDAALDSGAHYVSTDYPVANPDFTDYHVEIPGGKIARCNPVSAEMSCTAE